VGVLFAGKTIEAIANPNGPWMAEFPPAKTRDARPIARRAACM